MPMTNITLAVPDELMAQLDRWRDARFLPRGTAVKQLLATHPALTGQPSMTYTEMTLALGRAGYAVIPRSNKPSSDNEQLNDVRDKPAMKNPRLRSKEDD